MTSNLVQQAVVVESTAMKFGQITSKLALFNPDGSPFNPTSLGTSTVDSLTDATPVGKAVVKAADATAVRTMVGAVGKGETMIRVDDYLVGTGVEAETAAWQAAIAECKARARTVTSGLYRGVPRIYAGTREWLITTIEIKSIVGLTIQGDGMDSTVLRTDSGIPIFDVQRSSGLTLEGLTLTCGSANVGQAAVSGLIENSSGIWIHENSTDSGIPGSTTAIRLTRVRFHGFHRAVRITGNQMCDNITYDQCRWQDNFIDIENLNGQAVNQRVIGGEVDAWLNNTETAYNSRLALWSAVSIPVTAKPNQYQDPALSSGIQQNVTVRDGAVFRVIVGGEFHCDDRFSVVVLKTWLLLAAVPSDASTKYGVNVNALTFIYEGVTGEIRKTDTVLDSNGYQRCTLTRFELPHASDTDLVRIGATVIFKRLRLSIVQASLDLIHMAGPITIRWHDCRLLGATAAGNLRLCHTASGVTYVIPGDFDGQRSTILSPVITSRDYLGASAAVPVMGTFNVRQRDFAGGGIMAYDTTTPYVNRSRLRANNRPVEPVIYQWAAVDGTVLGANSSSVGQAKSIQVGIGAVIRRVGVVLSSVTSGTPSDIVLRFRDAASTVTYAELTAKWGTTTTATESVGAFGRIFDGHRRPWAEVHDFAPADGRILVEVITKTTAVIQGFAWVEAY